MLSPDGLHEPIKNHPHDIVTFENVKGSFVRSHLQGRDFLKSDS